MNSVAGSEISKFKYKLPASVAAKYPTTINPAQRLVGTFLINATPRSSCWIASAAITPNRMPMYPRVMEGPHTRGAASPPTIRGRACGLRSGEKKRPQDIELLLDAQG